MDEYTSCNWLQHGLSFENDHIAADKAGRLGVSITVLWAHPRDPLTAEFQSVMISITEIFGH